VGLLVAEVSFISLKLALLAAVALLAAGGDLVVLVKPQFEAGRGAACEGIMRDPAVDETVCADVAAFVERLGLAVIGLIPSPIDGGDGNREFLLGARRG
jgi:23S rRNA (cytidine1920-2'-O)/16S rRNA (cytidine1409-2'-O)-methyltransferase